MSQNFEPFKEKFQVETNLISETDYWRWSMRPLQCSIVAGVLCLKRPAEKMFELALEEGADLYKRLTAFKSLILI